MGKSGDGNKQNQNRSTVVTSRISPSSVSFLIVHGFVASGNLKMPIRAAAEV
ncbi:hypothetical protein BAP_3699 [Bacillus sp. CN2]|nr:hypothetical protein BAP_3699 [Bacillus sp. CN2]